MMTDIVDFEAQVRCLFRLDGDDEFARIPDHQSSLIH